MNSIVHLYSAVIKHVLDQNPGNSHLINGASTGQDAGTCVAEHLTHCVSPDVTVQVPGVITT